MEGRHGASNGLQPEQPHGPCIVVLESDEYGCSGNPDVPQHPGYLSPDLQ